LGLTQADIRVDRCAALRAACEHGHLRTAQWLIEQFNLTAFDIGECNALERACTSGHLRLAQWLVDGFGPSPAEADEWFMRDSTFRNTCVNGHLDVAQWFVDVFDPEVDDEWLWHATRGRVGPAVAEWLHEGFGGGNLVAVMRVPQHSDSDDDSDGSDSDGSDSDAAPPALPVKIFAGVSCTICLSAPASCAFSPCGHAAACAPCAVRCATPLEDAACPVCRAAIKSVWQCLL
jgi:hypothetical protein